MIGGVSLFGGRGRVSGALFGGLIIGMIANGIDLVGSADWIKYITTGAILLAAVTLDTVARAAARPRPAAEPQRSTAKAMFTVVRYALIRSSSTTALIETTDAPVIPRTVLAAS